MVFIDKIQMLILKNFLFLFFSK